MRRSTITAALLIGTISVANAAEPCDFAYLNFMQHLNYQADVLSAHRLATLHRQAGRIFDACDTGHLKNAEAKLRALSIH